MCQALFVLISLHYICSTEVSSLLALAIVLGSKERRVETANKKAASIQT